MLLDRTGRRRRNGRLVSVELSSAPHSGYRQIVPTVSFASTARLRPCLRQRMISTLPGRSLDITGKVPTSAAVERSSGKRNGAAVATAQLAAHCMADNDVITVESGAGSDRKRIRYVRHRQIRYRHQSQQWAAAGSQTTGKDRQGKRFGSEIQEGVVDKGFKKETAESGGTASCSPRPAGRKVSH